MGYLCVQCVAAFPDFKTTTFEAVGDGRAYFVETQPIRYSVILAAKRMYKEMTVSAQVLEIDEKHKASTASPSRISDFTFHAGDSIPANVIVANPAISLYCLDDANRCAVFVETDPGFDLLQAPFHYMAQHEHARRLDRGGDQGPVGRVEQGGGE